MSTEVKGLDITVMGREFRVACPENEERALLTSVEYLDRKMREIRDAGKVIGVERIAIMAALNIAHELLSGQGPAELDLGEYRRRIKDLEDKIEQAMSEQDDLF